MNITKKISSGRTDLIFDFMSQPNWQNELFEGRVKLIQWLVYYNDLTAIKALIQNGATLESIDLDDELGNAAFFGHWKICEFLIKNGANPNAKVAATNETPLHNALAKAGRPYYLYTLKILIENGAEVNAVTLPGKDTGAFMRDVRTKGETPLHRAAAYGDVQMIEYLLNNGADKFRKDAFGDTPLSWASQHLRTGRILRLLSYGEHQVSKKHEELNVSDHGAGWGNTMDWNLFGEYLPD